MFRDAVPRSGSGGDGRSDIRYGPPGAYANTERYDDMCEGSYDARGSEGCVRPGRPGSNMWHRGRARWTVPAGGLNGGQDCAGVWGTVVDDAICPLLVSGSRMLGGRRLAHPLPPGRALSRPVAGDDRGWIPRSAFTARDRNTRTFRVGCRPAAGRVVGRAALHRGRKSHVRDIRDVPRRSRRPGAGLVLATAPAKRSSATARAVAASERRRHAITIRPRGESQLLPERTSMLSARLVHATRWA